LTKTKNGIALSADPTPTAIARKKIGIDNKFDEQEKRENKR